MHATVSQVRKVQKMSASRRKAGHRVCHVTGSKCHVVTHNTETSRMSPAGSHDERRQVTAKRRPHDDAEAVMTEAGWCVRTDLPLGLLHLGPELVRALGHAVHLSQSQAVTRHVTEVTCRVTEVTAGLCSWSCRPPKTRVSHTRSHAMSQRPNAMSQRGHMPCHRNRSWAVLLVMLSA